MPSGLQIKLLTLSLLVTLCAAVISQRQHEIVKITIPWPPGIEIDKVTDNQGRTYRFGRLQHNSISLRPHWGGIHVVDEVLSSEECESIIKRAESFGSNFGWSKGRHVDYGIRPTKDLPLEVIFDNSEDLASLQLRFVERLLPVMAEKFEIDVGRIRPTDIFVTKYNASTSERFLGPHKDKSPWSFVVSLNDNYKGGGTYFSNKEKTWQVPAGSAVVFSGNQLHGANAVTTGVRYILAGFCEYGDDLPLESSAAHGAFMASYDPKYDGFAALAGFRSGDQIVGLEVCELSDIESAPECRISNDADAAAIDDAMSCVGNLDGQRIVRQQMDITGFTSDHDWQKSAQSCEHYEPGGNTVIWVRRKLE